jgi:hypothetical protein
VVVILALAAYFVVLAALLGPVVWKWRDRAAWSTLEIASIIGPLVVWTGLTLLGQHEKSLNNLVVEPGILGLTVALVGWLRAAMTSKLGPSRAAGMCMCLALVFGWFVWAFVPWLPE